MPLRQKYKHNTLIEAKTAHATKERQKGGQSCAQSRPRGGSFKRTMNRSAPEAVVLKEL